MAFSDRLLAAGADVWGAQMDHPFVTELAAGELADAAFRHWIEQDYRYLLDYARVFAVCGARARDEETMRTALGVAHATLADEMELHREFAADYGVTREELAAVEKAPTCEAYTSFLVRTAYEGSVAETLAALFPCAQGFLDVADHAASLAVEDHRYTPWIETYTADAFREVVADVRALVDRYADRFPGEHDAMREAFLTSARLEYRFWEMAYTEETWVVDTDDDRSDE